MGGTRKYAGPWRLIRPAPGYSPGSLGSRGPLAERPEAARRRPRPSGPKFEPTAEGALAFAEKHAGAVEPGKPFVVSFGADGPRFTFKVVGRGRRRRVVPVK